jgi:hypothetical protein
MPKMNGCAIWVNSLKVNVEKRERERERERCISTTRQGHPLVAIPVARPNRRPFIEWLKIMR